MECEEIVKSVVHLKDREGELRHTTHCVLNYCRMGVSLLPNRFTIPYLLHTSNYPCQRLTDHLQELANRPNHWH